VEAILDDYRNAPIPNKEKIFWAFIEKVALRSNRISQKDVDEAKAAGWTDEELYDAITVCALFKFYNTWIDATGVQAMPDFAYDMSGKRLAAVGYAPEPDGEPDSGR
jgi:alkylhydroperoxidase family enzyme